MSEPLISVVVPTFEEAANVRGLVPALHGALAQAFERGSGGWEIILVDDDSGDGIENVCEALAADYPVRLLVRHGERGLSSAVLEGFRLARGDVLVVMDADFSHPPAKVPELVRALSSEDVDFVIGSRYVNGGAMAGERGWLRRVMSRVATLMARPLVDVRDPMAGFFALQRETLERASRLDPLGFKIGLELLVRCRCRHPFEVPIIFSPRLQGHSKLGVLEGLRYLHHLARLYYFKISG